MYIQMYDDCVAIIVIWIKSIQELETGCQFSSSGLLHSLLVLWWDLYMSGD